MPSLQVSLKTSDSDRSSVPWSIRTFTQGVMFPASPWCVGLDSPEWPVFSTDLTQGVRFRLPSWGVGFVPLGSLSASLFSSFFYLLEKECARFLFPCWAGFDPPTLLAITSTRYRRLGC